MRRLVSDTVPADPQDPDYRLTGALAKFRRVKGRGLPRRYRLFFAFSDQARVIIFLFLNDDATLRKQGASSDAFAVFARLVDRGEIGGTFDEAHDAWTRHRDARGS